MIEHPSMAELVDAVSDWMASGSEGGAYADRIARNALATVRRELEHGATAEREAKVRLIDLLGREGSFDGLNAELALAIRNGLADIDSPALRAHLRATALDMLAIDQPRYAHLLHRDTAA